MKTASNHATAYALGGMDVFPVASREARVASRKILSYDIRSVIAGVFVLVAFRRMFAPIAGPVGPAMFETLAYMGYFYAAIAGAFKTFDTLSREKREGTLGLLLLTDLRPFQILIGKLLSASALTFFGLVAFLPILSLPLIVGGITFDQFMRLAVALVTALLLSMSWGLYISAATRNYIVALTGAAALVLTFAFLPIAVATDLNPSVATYPQEILVALFTPALPFKLAFSINPEFTRFFWPAILCNITLAAAWIAAAVIVLPHRCHEAPGKNRLLHFLRNSIHDFRFGNPRRRARTRRRLLDVNPLYWLSHRDRVTSAGLIALCLILLTLAQLFDLPQLGLFLASLAILFRMAHASSHAMSEDQKNGALELLLGSNLHVDEIISGLYRSMLRRFLFPVALVIIWPWFVIVPNADELFRTLLIWSSILLIATWLALSRVGPWFALRKNPSVAAWTSLAVVVLPPWFIWIISIFPGLFHPEYTDIQSIGAIVCAGVGVFHCALVTRWGHGMLRLNFREAAADPFATIQFEPGLPGLMIESGVNVIPIGNGEVQVTRRGRFVRLVAIPKENHIFAEWAGHARGADNPLELELQANAYILARFKVANNVNISAGTSSANDFGKTAKTQQGHA